MADISRSIKKVDNRTKMSGQEQYVNDIQIEDIYYAKTYRSTLCHGKIKSIVLPDLPEGISVISAEDITGENYVNMIFQDFPILASKKVTYYGEPILLVIGQDKEEIETVIQNIQVEYESLPPVFEYKNSVIHYDYHKSDIDTSQYKEIDFTYETGYQEQLYIEPQGLIGYMEGDKVTIVGSMQCPYYIKAAVVQALNVDESLVRIKQSSVGGAFGGKEEFPSVMACQLAIAVKKTGHSIKMIYERREDLNVTTKRHPATIQLKAYISDNNEIMGVKSHVSIDSGAHIGLSGVVLQRAMIASSGAYTFPHMNVSGDVYETNTVPNGAFRGFGAPQMFFAVEMFIHHIAKELQIDPLELRKKYLAKQGDLTSTSGHYRDEIIMPKMIQKALDASHYSAKLVEFSKHNQHVKKTFNDKYKGIGMAWFLHGCGFTGSGEQKHIKALVKLEKNEENLVTILIAAVDMGQGITTTMRKIVAHELNLPIEQVIYEHPDTDKVPDSGPTVASRTIMIVGGLILEATKELKEKWVDGEAISVSNRYKQPEYIKWDEDTLTGDAYPAYSWGVNVVEVEVCPITYEVSLKGVWSVYDIGKAIDERIIIGQSVGGTIQGIGYGMLEKMEHKEGKIQQASVTDYVIPTAMDVAPIETYIIDNPFALGPYGAKGAGELTLVGGAPAVALAIENAIGKQVQKIPVVPEYIMELMKNGKS